jgi:hypothetical protein
VTFDVEDAPPFIALSYTWGPPNNKAPDKETVTGQSSRSGNYHVGENGAAEEIQVNGLELRVTQNLYDALKCMAMRCKNCPSAQTEFFWIDTICINQDDTEEKSAQVSLMGQIYSKAKMVWIWLGHRDGIDMDRVRSLIRKLATASRHVQQHIGNIGQTTTTD